MNPNLPALYIDVPQVEINIKKILNNIDNQYHLLRPHFKTHQSLQIAEIFRKFGINKCTVSSPEMAIYFAEGNWKDILIAVPFDVNKVNLYNRLKELKINYILTISSLISLEYVSMLPQGSSFYIEIDTGNHRTGFDPNIIDSIIYTYNKLNEFGHNVVGIMSHGGHSYSAKSRIELNEIRISESKIMNKVKSSLNSDLIISIGDSPTCSVSNYYEEIDELRPGVFVFYDLMMNQIDGVCKLNEISAHLLASIIDINYDTGKVVLNCGSVHLSKDSIQISGNTVFGQLCNVEYNNNKYIYAPITNALITKLYQEHAIAYVDADELKKLSIFNTIAIIPVHSCLAADIQTHYYDDMNKVIHKLNV